MATPEEAERLSLVNLGHAQLAALELIERDLKLIAQALCHMAWPDQWMIEPDDFDASRP